MADRTNDQVQSKLYNLLIHNRCITNLYGLNYFQGHELPGVVHIKAWFGKTRHRNAWLKLIKPGIMRYYAELFYNERRKMFTSSFKQTEKKPFTISDETGKIELSESAIHPPSGWMFEKEWVPKRSHDMWVGADAGHTTFEDEFFEVEMKDSVTQEWKPHTTTGYYGDPIEPADLNQAPTGWTYETPWSVDLHCPGDADGWQYSMGEEFWDETSGMIDTVERQTHKYRRRRHKRRRCFATSDVGVTEMFEDMREIIKTLDEEGWEVRN